MKTIIQLFYVTDKFPQWFQHIYKLAYLTVVTVDRQWQWISCSRKQEMEFTSQEVPIVNYLSIVLSLTCTYTSTHTHTKTYMYTNTRTYIHVNTWTPNCLFPLTMSPTHLCMHTFTQTHAHTYLLIYIHKRIHTYLHTNVVKWI